MYCEDCRAEVFVTRYSERALASKSKCMNCGCSRLLRRDELPAGTAPPKELAHIKEQNRSGKGKRHVGKASSKSGTTRSGPYLHCPDGETTETHWIFRDPQGVEHWIPHWVKPEDLA